MKLIFAKKKTRIIAGIIFVAILLFLFLHVFPGNIILPQFFTIVGHRVYYYGLILAASVLAGYFFARNRLSQLNLTLSQLDNIVLIMIAFGFVGARSYHVVSSFSYYSAHPIEIFYVWNGGLSIFGAIIAALLALLIYYKYYLKTASSSANFSFYSLLDFLVPSVILGQAIGRFGNLFNYEIYGPPTNLPWKMFVPIQFRIPPYETFQFFHPLFLYESLACLLIFVVLVKWVDIKKPGKAFAIWLGLYNLLRLLTEFLRIDSPYLLGFKQNYLTAGLLVIIAIVIFIKVTYKKNYEPQSPQNL